MANCSDKAASMTINGVGNDCLPCIPNTNGKPVDDPPVDEILRRDPCSGFIWFYDCDEGWMVLPPSIAALEEMDVDVLGNVCEQLKIPAFQDDVGACADQGYIDVGTLAEEIFQCICASITPGDGAATSVLACNGTNFEVYDLAHPCDYVAADSNLATNALTCVSGQLLLRPLPTVCNSVVVGSTPATHATFCDDGVFRQRPIDICALISAYDGGAEAVRECLGVVPNPIVEVGDGDSGHLTITQSVNESTGQITYSIESDLVGTCEKSDVPSATLADSVSTKFEVCVTDSTGAKTTGLIDLPSQNTTSPLHCIPQVDTQSPSGAAPGDNESPIRRDCQGTLWVYICTSGVWAAVRPSVDGLDVLDPDNVTDICENLNFLTWYDQGDCTNQREVPLGELATLIGQCSGNDIVHVFTEDATYTPNPDARYVHVMVLGGGAGGANTGGGSAVSAGGSAGGEAWGLIDNAALGPTETITIGAGGAVGAFGGTTSFGAHLSATGGGTDLGIVTEYPEEGGVGSGGYLNLTGNRGFSADVKSQGGVMQSGAGASSRYGAGGVGRSAGADQNVLKDASGYGAGGAGVYNSDLSTPGEGSGGLCIVWEIV